MYDSYISLGDNCEVGLQLRRIGYEHSSFFRFTASPFKSTYQIIENDFQNIFLKESLVPRVCRDRETVMVRDTKYDIGIHAAMPYVKTEKGRNLFIQNEAFNAAYDREYSKVRYLIEKWNSLVKSDQNVLYLIKAQDNTSRENAEKLLDLLNRKYPNHHFSIVYLQLEKYREPDWGIPRLYNRYLPRFAPFSHAKGGDAPSWDKLFLEFPLSDNNNERKFRIRDIAKHYSCRRQLHPQSSGKYVHRWHLEFPQPGQITDLLLRGWVVGKNLPVVSIELIDEEKEQVIKAIPVDRYRPAVAKQFENITNAATAGFATELSDVLMALESYPSTHKILLQIVLSDRTKVSIETLEFVKV
jgi:Putative papain-like cysteine peptidase (DUF1796)